MTSINTLRCTASISGILPETFLFFFVRVWESMCHNYHGNLHSITVGVRQVTEDEQRSLLGQRASHREVPELRADVFNRGALKHTHNRSESALLVRNNHI